MVKKEVGGRVLGDMAWLGGQGTKNEKPAWTKKKTPLEQKKGGTSIRGNAIKIRGKGGEVPPVLLLSEWTHKKDGDPVLTDEEREKHELEMLRKGKFQRSWRGAG